MCAPALGSLHDITFGVQIHIVVRSSDIATAHTAAQCLAVLVSHPMLRPRSSRAEAVATVCSALQRAGGAPGSAWSRTSLLLVLTALVRESGEAGDTARCVVARHACRLLSDLAPRPADKTGCDTSSAAPEVCYATADLLVKTLKRVPHDLSATHMALLSACVEQHRLLACWVGETAPLQLQQRCAKLLTAALASLPRHRAGSSGTHPWCATPSPVHATHIGAGLAQLASDCVPALARHLRQLASRDGAGDAPVQSHLVDGLAPSASDDSNPLLFRRVALLVAVLSRQSRAHATRGGQASAAVGPPCAQCECAWRGAAKAVCGAVRTATGCGSAVSGGRSRPAVSLGQARLRLLNVFATHDPSFVTIAHELLLGWPWGCTQGSPGSMQQPTVAMALSPPLVLCDMMRALGFDATVVMDLITSGVCGEAWLCEFVPGNRVDKVAVCVSRRNVLSRVLRGRFEVACCSLG